MAFLAQEPHAQDIIKPYVGAEEFINAGRRWIIAPSLASPSQLRALPLVRQRVKAVREWRSKSARSATRMAAATPEQFGISVIPKTAFLAIPQVSSERRDYVPIGWLEPPTIPSEKLRLLEDATLWEFAILTSRMHMAWMRQITGRMKSDYMYSVGVVYNTFPWPDATPAQRTSVESLAQAVLDARALPQNADSTLADLYDPDTMPLALRRAHRDLDQAVDRLYRRAPFASDRARVEHLFTLYQQLCSG